ncbi:RNA polymerase sigma factor [Carboxydothermus pertinax]|uniref:RNA polymerase sigma factor n=1 Tax=Carboxydothermus pertinax TaxID=870242 RepID=A0A1L8CY96_9THEO|nr:RNA polymerase sigma factor [Carboxydothermus pertinax]GAV23890.1 RNA polymerase subunit sigma-24 [Carboxydothermus pertinax]
MHIKENSFWHESTENTPTFEEVITENENKIMNLLYGMTGDYHLAQDLTQETFIKAFKSWHSFKGRAAVSTWLYRIAVNVALDYQRKRAVRYERVSEEMESLTVSFNNYEQDPDNACQKNALRDILFASIAKLPPQQKEVFILREINGCSTKEVAAILDCSEALVKWRLHKARSALKKLLQQEQFYKNAGKFKLNGLGIE